MKIRLAWLLLIAGLLLVIPLNTVRARSYYAERFDVQIDLQADGTFLVTETVVFRFEGGPYTYAFRDLALNELDRVEIVEAGMDGQVLPPGVQPGQVEISSGGNPIEITWHFPPTSEVSRTFTLVYRVYGNIRRVAGLDGLLWKAIPEEHEYDINTSTITINYPASLIPAGDPALDGASFQVQQFPGKIVFSALTISKNTPLVVDVRFPQGSLIQAPPGWQAAQIHRSQQTGAAMPYALAAGAGILVVSLAVIGLYRRKNNPVVLQKFPTGIITSPPEDLTASQAGYLAGNVQVSLFHAFAALLDLTRRGWLKMQETESRGLFKARDFIVTPVKSGDGLQLHEMVLIDNLFKIRREKRNSVKMSEIGAKFSSRLSVFSKALRSELVAKGYLQPERLRQRSQIGGWAFVIFVIGMLLCVVGAIYIGLSARQMAFYGVIMLGVGLGLVASGVVFWITSSSWGVLSDKGITERDRWISFRDHLKGLIRSKAELRNEWLDNYLPYAVSFRLGDSWVKAYKDRGMSTVLPWVLSASGGYADGVVVSAAITSSSVASASGGGGGGGGGASGAG